MKPDFVNGLLRSATGMGSPIGDVAPDFEKDLGKGEFARDACVRHRPVRASKRTPVLMGGSSPRRYGVQT
jgi:hypothetical protein